MNSTLLLNASYEPIKVISWRKAISLFFLDKVEVVECYSMDIRSVSVSVKMPSVVRLLRYANISKRKPRLSKLNLLARDNYQCQYCSTELDFSNATFDHVVPRSHQGETSWENLVIACGSCNRKKGGRTPKEARMKLHKKPVAPDWLPILHFRYEDDLPQAWLDFL